VANRYKLFYTTDAEIERVVKASHTFTECLKKLGVTSGRTTIMNIRRRIDRLKLDISHFRTPNRPLLPITHPQSSSVMDITDAEFTEAIEHSTSFHHFGRIINQPMSGGTITTIKRRAAVLGVSLDHFVYERLKGGGAQRKVKALLTNRQRFVNKPGLRRRLVAEGVLKEECGRCGQGPVWQDKPLGLTLFHKNMNALDFRIENLEILCPNCHSQAVQPKRSETGKKGAKVRSELRERQAYEKLLGRDHGGAE
jgi:hypothetical protein